MKILVIISSLLFVSATRDRICVNDDAGVRNVCTARVFDDASNINTMLDNMLSAASNLKLVEFNQNPSKPFDPTIGLDKVVTAMDGQKVFQAVRGPESFAEANGNLYVGSADGYIYKLDQTTGGAARVLTTCNRFGEECGHPLGMRFSADNATLYVADGLQGLISFDIQSGEKTIHIKNGDLIDGKPLTFPDDLAVSKSGIVYLTDGSTKYPLAKFPFTMLEMDNTGRIVTFDTNSKETGVLVDGYHFPNGIEISNDDQSILFNEFNAKRVMKVPLEGDNKGTVTVFADLPGEPDNIRRSPTGGYWVALCFYRDQGVLAPFDGIANQTKLSNSFVQAMASGEMFLQVLGVSLNYPGVQAASKELMNGYFIVDTFSPNGAIVRLSDDGEIQYIIRTEGHTLYSQVFEHDSDLFIGSYRNHYALKVRDVKKE